MKNVCTYTRCFAQKKSERCTMRIIDDDAATRNARDSSIDTRHIARVLGQILDIRRPASPHRPRQVAISRSGRVHPKNLIRLEVLPAAERLLSHTGPERTFPKMGAAAADVVILQPALPEVGPAADRNETRQSPEEQREECAS